MSLFGNLRALFTSLGSSERQELEALWEEHGGKVVASVTPNDPPHVVITRRVGSSKYVMLMRRHPNTHVVPPEWIRKSVEVKKKQPYSQFRVGALYGLKICLSGFDVEKKGMLADLISRNGGAHSPSLTKFCTHLVSTDRTTQKYMFAVKHGIVCCSVEWLEESTNGKVKWCRDATKYHVKDKEMSLVIARADTCDADTFAGVSKRERENAANATNITNATGNTNVCDDITEITGGVRKRVAEKKKEKGAVEERGRRRGNDAGDDADGKDAAAKARDSGDGEELHSDGSLEANDASFLKDCGIWHVGLSSAELKELVSLCCKSGATRVRYSHPTLVTHIVRGSEACTRGEREEINKALRAHVNPPQLVNMDWLRACVRSRRELEADQERFRPSKEDDGLLSRLASGGASAVASAAAGGNTNATKTNTNTNTNTNGAPDRLDELDPIDPIDRLDRLDRTNSGVVHPYQNAADNNEASNGSISGIFAGYYFTLCAVRGTAEEQVAEVLIRQHGGKINNSSVPASGEGTLLAICPPSLTRIDASRLRAHNNNNFGSVPEDNRFTLYWIKCCAKARKMLGHQDGAPCFRPLPYDLPMEGMRNVSISTSGYDDDIKSAIKFTVETIGGRFSAKNMSAKDTHLIVPFAHGEKYRHSDRLGVTAVTAQWLVETVKSGRLLPEARFRPGPKPGCEPDAMAPGNPTGNVETTQHAWDHVAKTKRMPTADVPPPVGESQPHAPPQHPQAKKARPQHVEAVAKTATTEAADNRDKTVAPVAGSPTAPKPRKVESASDPTNDDLAKAGMQVTSLISRLQTTGAKSAAAARPSAGDGDGDDQSAKASAARPSKRGSSSRRVGLHQAEAAPRRDDDEEDDAGLVMVEVSQRVGYLHD